IVEQFRANTVRPGRSPFSNGFLKQFLSPDFGFLRVKLGADKSLRIQAVIRRKRKLLKHEVLDFTWIVKGQPSIGANSPEFMVGAQEILYQKILVLFFG